MKQPELTAQILGMYIGRPCDVLDTDEEFIYSGILSLPNTDYWVREMYVLRPHLRRLENITEEEIETIGELEFSLKKNGIIKAMTIGKPSVWLYLLSRGFDLFGLIDAGLAKEVSA